VRGTMTSSSASQEVGSPRMGSLEGSQLMKASVDFRAKHKQARCELWPVSRRPVMPTLCRASTYFSTFSKARAWVAGTARP